MSTQLLREMIEEILLEDWVSFLGGHRRDHKKDLESQVQDAHHGLEVYFLTHPKSKRIFTKKSEDDQHKWILKNRKKLASYAAKGR